MQRNTKAPLNAPKATDRSKVSLPATLGVKRRREASPEPIGKQNSKQDILTLFSAKKSQETTEEGFQGRRNEACGKLTSTQNIS